VIKHDMNDLMISAVDMRVFSMVQNCEYLLLFDHIDFVAIRLLLLLLLKKYNY
jgi:hypothetical protein